MKASMYLNYTTRSLWRGGQRTLLAIFCVAVGVMAIVSLQLVGLMINNAFNGNVRDANGGDIQVRSQNQPFRQSDLSYFDQLKKDGTISNYTAVINAQGSTGANVSLRESFSVRIVDPTNYPVVTPPTFTQPSGGSIASLLKNNQVIVTQPFIDQYKKKLGDSFTIHTGSSDQGGYLTLHVKLAGIVTESGVLAQSGSVVLLSIHDYQAAINALPATTSPRPPASTGQAGGTAPGQGAPASSSQGSQTPTTTASRPLVLYDTINVTAAPDRINAAVKKIQDQFPIANVQTAADALKQQQATIDNIKKYLEIAGLLALLIGGVGIINTMQVLLSRRRTEIAMLKTTGYRRYDLYLLFGLEAGLLGLIGGLVGAAAATGISYIVRTVVEQSFQLNIPFLLDWFTIGGGVVIGLATALIFGLLPIVQAANIRPLNVIRELPEGQGAGSVVLTIFLLVVLSILFCLLAIVILNNDVRLGVISVYGVFAFLGLLSLFFGLVIVLISRLPVPERFSLKYVAFLLVMVALAALLYLVLPIFGILLGVAAMLGFVIVLVPRPWKSTARMAFRNLGRQRVRTTTTMLALFVGIFTIALILVLGQNLHDQVNKVIANALNYNVFAITSNDDTTKLQSQLSTVPGLDSYHQDTLASTVPVLINNKPIGKLLPQGNNAKASANSLGRSGALYFLSGVEGYNVGNNQVPRSDSMSITRGRNLQPADAGTNNVVVSSLLAELGPLHLKLGDKIVLSGVDRTSTATMTIVGFYESKGLGSSLYPILGTTDTVNALSPQGVSQAVFYMKVDPNKLSKAVDVIGRIVPNAFVLNLANISDFIDQLLNDILLTLTTIASLTLVAGMIIIANAVALAMLERRRELGILKSVGYTGGSILSEVLFENGLVGGTGALLAMLLVTLVTFLLGKYVFSSPFTVSGVTTLEMIGGSIVLAMLISALVAWGAVRVRPLEVLRYE